MYKTLYVYGMDLTPHDYVIPQIQCCTTRLPECLGRRYRRLRCLHFDT